MYQHWDELVVIYHPPGQNCDDDNNDNLQHQYGCYCLATVPLCDCTRFICQERKTVGWSRDVRVHSY